MTVTPSRTPRPDGDTGGAPAGAALGDLRDDPPDTSNDDDNALTGTATDDDSTGTGTGTGTGHKATPRTTGAPADGTDSRPHDDTHAPRTTHGDTDARATGAPADAVDDEPPVDADGTTDHAATARTAGGPGGASADGTDSRPHDDTHAPRTTHGDTDARATGAPADAVDDEPPVDADGTTDHAATARTAGGPGGASADGTDSRPHDDTHAPRTTHGDTDARATGAPADAVDDEPPVDAGGTTDRAATARTAGGPGGASVRAGEPAGLPAPSRRFLARAALVTAVLSVAGSLLGLVRDQALARLFGAGSDTDAFLVAWTVPEFAATLLIEDGLAFALIPAFSVALARRSRGAAGDPVRALVAGTLPRLSLAFVAVGVLVVLLAPPLVEVLAPGLPDPRLAVDCTRLTATCAVSFGLAGYCSAALRAHRRFTAPAAIYVAYNVGIVAGMFVLAGRWGVRSAAVGVAVGGCLMVAVQLPSLLGQLRRRPTGASAEAPAEAPSGAGAEPRPLGAAVVASVLLFAVCRQSQVLVERFLASNLPSGAISHLNYAQKVAQMPMILSLMLCTVTFPVVARALAEGDTERARGRVERDLALAACVVLLGTATVVACAPQIIGLLFQRGAFTAADTAATAGVMRVYALGLLGQTLVGALVRSYFSGARPSWYPFGAMAVGIAVTAWLGALGVGRWGVYGIAAANAAGITVTALVLLAGMGPRSVPIRVRPVLHELSRPLRAALAAALAGTLAADRCDGPLAGLAAGALTVTAVFVLLGRALDAQGVTAALRSVRSATRRLPYVRSR